MVNYALHHPWGELIDGLLRICFVSGSSSDPLLLLFIAVLCSQLIDFFFFEYLMSSCMRDDYHMWNM